jgi:signal transduction histidine kinase/AmiR/NasT family two-component response regulator
VIISAAGRPNRLRRSRAASTKAAARIARVGVWEVDFIAQQTFFSPELCELMDCRPMPAMPISQSLLFWLEEDRPGFLKSLDGVATFGERFTFEGRSVGADGLVRWWRLLGEPEWTEERCVAVYGAAQDITEWRVRLERERVAIRAVDQLSGFMATMSHEIRTPLNGVLGMAQAMGRGELCEPQRERLKVIETAGAALLSLVDDLLDLANVKAGNIELASGVVDTQDLADIARTTFKALVQDKNVSFRVTVAQSARGCWVGDPKRIRQVMRNLISNAVKFTEYGSVAVELSHTSNRVVMRVQDTGIGISSERLASVFDGHVQADASTTPRYGGSGLGLTVCRDLVNLMKGDIQVEVVPSGGTAFVVRLPLARLGDAASARPSPERPEPAPCADTGLRVLAAEDNAVNQLILKTLLAEFGIVPVLVSNGQEALDAWRAAEWDIVLMDIQMPVMDGVTAVKLLREAERREGRRRTPIVAVTANAIAHQKVEYLAAGMDALVAKPIDLACLVQTMDAALGGYETSQMQPEG